ncbi:MAG: PIN domain-containing protein [Bryobacterales bacterium]|nr:PIN domain-containing protein [Bryobacterales bacterium]
MRIALDTNVLAHAEGTNGDTKRDQTLEILGNLPQQHLVLPVQTLGELFNVLVRKAGRTSRHARAAVLSWRDAFTVTETSQAVMVGAADLAAEHGLSIWDAVVLCTAAEAGCRLLLSEDLQDGFIWGGVTVANPYASALHPLLAARLKGQ